jgi:phage gp36-like protein
MPYATSIDITNRYGSNALLIAADRDNDGVVDTAAVERALNDASALIDTYIGARYSLPLPEVPDVLMAYCVDIALYKLSADIAYTEEKRKRYDDAISGLVNISKGIATLTFISGGEPDTSTGDVELISADRQFSRKSMRSVL